MNIRSGLLITCLAALPACSLFDDSDPREGAENVNACVARFTGAMSAQFRTNFDRLDTGVWSPTYTYDVTKMDLENLQALMVEGSDESAGRRLTASTNEVSTAVAQFNAMPVDEKGAFFMGRDPALYRVRGEPAPKDKLIAAGCERQQSNMRLVRLDWAPAPPAPEANDEADAATENENTN
ncbi:hypothetical protein [Erythrobacter sp. MTPC3]|uniref:hypothetical protein n=1 Tax=Erythrobacter sp. MTPC3 TaxID=3056564 RepID=UPI0036F2F057